MQKLKIISSRIQHKFSSFSGVCRIVKRWLSAHYLFDYFEEEAIDLMCAHIFLNNKTPYEPPKYINFSILCISLLIFLFFSFNYRTAIIGFFRFLDFISNFDWKNQFLTINFNNESLGIQFSISNF